MGKIASSVEDERLQLQLALRAGRMGTWRHDLVTGQQDWDDTQYALFGVDTTVEPTREVFMSLVHPDDVGRVGFTEDDLRPGHFRDTEFRIIRRSDGQIRWITARSFARHDAYGRAILRIGVNWDITEQKLAELELTDAERRLQLATDAAEIGIWDWDVTTGEFYYSPRARALYGFTPDEVLTYARLQERTYPDDYLQIDPMLRRVLDPALREHAQYQYRITRADNGEERWLLAHGSAVFSGPGPDAKPLRYTGTLQDITEEVRTRALLEDQQTRLELAIGAGELAVWEIDLRTNTITTSPELNALYRFEPSARPTIEDFGALYAAGERARVEAETAEAMARGETAIRFEAKHQWPDGLVKWIAVRAQLNNGEDGKPVRLIGVAMDVTERRLSEERLRVTARELQHRVKNNLTIVQTLAARTFRSARSMESGITAFNGRLRALATATELLTSANWEHVSVADVVDASVRPYRDDGALERFALTGEPLRISSKDAVSLGMALHELCTNAVKYGSLSAESGRVSVSWLQQDGRVALEWRETGGPSVVPPADRGFGTQLLQSGLFGSNGGIELEFPSEGVVCRIVIPV